MYLDKKNLSYWCCRYNKNVRWMDFLLWIIGKKVRYGPCEMRVNSKAWFDEDDSNILKLLLAPFKIVYLIFEVISTSVIFPFVLIGSVKF